jgi:hypothetical protein
MPLGMKVGAIVCVHRTRGRLIRGNHGDHATRVLRRRRWHEMQWCWADSASARLYAASKSPPTMSEGDGIKLKTGESSESPCEALPTLTLLQ